MLSCGRCGPSLNTPLARAQGQRNVQNTLSWLQAVQAMGPEALAAVNLPQAARFLGDALGVPSDLILNDAQPSQTMEILNDELLANDEASARAAASVF